MRSGSSTTPASVTLEEWTVGDTSSTASLLVEESVTSESLIETMLTGEAPASPLNNDGGVGNVR